MVDAVLWAGKVFWNCFLFYAPWRCYAAAEARVRSAYRARQLEMSR